jgi:hypothetical protein
MPPNTNDIPFELSPLDIDLIARARDDFLNDFGFLEKVLKEAARAIARNPELAALTEAKVRGNIDEMTRQRNEQRRELAERRKPRQINGYHYREDALVEIAVIDNPGSKTKMLPRLQWREDHWRLYYSDAPDAPESGVREWALPGTRESGGAALRAAERYLEEHYTSPRDGEKGENKCPTK